MFLRAIGAGLFAGGLVHLQPTLIVVGLLIIFIGALNDY